MSFYKASKKAEDVQQGGGSNYINKSGIYPVSILASFVSTGQNGAQSIDLYIDHKDQKQVVYGNLRITNNDGSPNKIGSKVFNQLVIISGADEIADPVEHELPIGVKGAQKKVDVLEDLCDIDVMMRVQMEYNVYNNNIQEKKVIKAFFRASDNATAEEIINETEAGVSFQKETKYADNVTYKDGLTAEDVQQWIADKRPKGTGGSGGSPEKADAPKFGKKRFGE